MKAFARIAEEQSFQYLWYTQYVPTLGWFHYCVFWRPEATEDQINAYFESFEIQRAIEEPMRSIKKPRL